MSFRILNDFFPPLPPLPRHLDQGFHTIQVLSCRAVSSVGDSLAFNGCYTWPLWPHILIDLFFDFFLMLFHNFLQPSLAVSFQNHLGASSLSPFFRSFCWARIVSAIVSSDVVLGLRLLGAGTRTVYIYLRTGGRNFVALRDGCQI